MGSGTTRCLWRGSARAARTDLQLRAASLSLCATELSLRAPLLDIEASNVTQLSKRRVMMLTRVTEAENVKRLKDMALYPGHRGEGV